MKYFPLLILLVSCGEHNRRIVCDSFITPWSTNAYIDNGVVTWVNEGAWGYRKMNQGELCYEQRKGQPQ